MKMRIASLSVLALWLTLAAVPAMAQVVYSNGPTNGNTDAWTVNFGFIVSDTFNTNSPDTLITGVNFATWMFPGDTLSNAEISITSSENGGTSYFDSPVNFTQSGCVGNQYGYNVCNEASQALDINLAATGTYWLNIQNASVASGDPVYWDENSGPSSASENTVGTIPSESFTVLGTQSTTTTSTTTTGTTPEPSSILLLGSGILGLAGVLRRKLF
jgi:PEP-CTERM motif-containing protein